MNDLERDGCVYMSISFCFMMSAVCKETKKWYGMGWYQAFLM